MSRHHQVVLDLERIVKERLADWPSEWQGYNYPGYAFEHTLRVRNLAVAIAREEGADVVVVELAALLHDAGKPKGEPHSETGARAADAILSSLGVGEATGSRVRGAILTHLRDDPDDPLENRVLRDADVLDSNHGYVGYFRDIAIRAHQGSTVAEIHASTTDWLPRLEERIEQHHTRTAQSMARRRFSRVECFRARLEGELRRAQPGIAHGIVEWVAADGERPSVCGQARGLEEAAMGKRAIAHLEPAAFLREFVGDLKREIAGEV